MTDQYVDFFCSRDVVLSLIKAGVPANSKWGALILYMRSISEYDYLSEEQKRQMQDLVMQIVREKDYSEVRFKEFVRGRSRSRQALEHEDGGGVPRNRGAHRAMRSQKLTACQGGQGPARDDHQHRAERTPWRDIVTEVRAASRRSSRTWRRIPGGPIELATQIP
jgi:hypothetical protein